MDLKPSPRLREFARTEEMYILSEFEKADQSAIGLRMVHVNLMVKTGARP